MAVTVGPGLVGALLVGMAAAKAVSLATGAPLIGVNHLEGHIWANFLAHGKPEPPYVALVVSGGHTMLVHIGEVHHHEVLGQTLDDAAGEAFDKVARLLGLGFPGGPALDALAAEGDPAAIAVPARDGGLGRPRLLDERAEDGGAPLPPRRTGGRPGGVTSPTWPRPSRKRSSTSRSRRRSRRPRNAASTRSCWAAGSSRTRDSASGWLRRDRARGLRVLFPPLDLCTDNAAMIAAVGAARLALGERSSLDIAADPNLRLAT